MPRKRASRERAPSAATSTRARYARGGSLRTGDRPRAVGGRELGGRNGRRLRKLGARLDGGARDPLIQDDALDGDHERPTVPRRRAPHRAGTARTDEAALGRPPPSCAAGPAGGTPIRSRWICAPAVTASPHSLSRGKRALSSRRTRRPWRTRYHAQVAPRDPRRRCRHRKGRRSETWSRRRLDRDGRPPRVPPARSR